LVRIQFARSAKAHAALFGCFPTGPGPLTNQIPFELGDAGENWRFAIQDNGLGINPEYKEKIFGLFKRLHG